MLWIARVPSGEGELEEALPKAYWRGGEKEKRLEVMGLEEMWEHLASVDAAERTPIKGPIPAPRTSDQIRNKVPSWCTQGRSLESIFNVESHVFLKIVESMELVKKYENPLNLFFITWSISNTQQYMRIYLIYPKRWDKWAKQRKYAKIRWILVLTKHLYATLSHQIEIWYAWSPMKSCWWNQQTCVQQMAPQCKILCCGYQNHFYPWNSLSIIWNAKCCSCKRESSNLMGRWFVIRCNWPPRLSWCTPLLGVDQTTYMWVINFGVNDWKCDPGWIK